MISRIAPILSALALSFAATFATACGGHAARPPVQPVAGEQSSQINGNFDLLSDRLVDDVVADVAEAIGRGELDVSRMVLEALVAETPAGWSPIQQTDRGVEIAAWSFAEVLVYVAAEQPSGDVTWVGPSYSRARFLLGVIAVETGDLATAAVHLDAGLALEPDHPDLLSERGVVAIMERRAEVALSLFEKAAASRLAGDAQKARALRGQGGALLELDRLDDAEASFRASLEIEPDNKVASNELEYIRQVRAGEIERSNSQILR